MVKNSGGLDAVLDRMVDHLLAYEEIPFLDLVQFVWRQGWDLSTAKEQKDKSNIRSVLKACLIERMVEIWQMPPKSISMNAPKWCETVQPLDEPFSVISPQNRYFWEDEKGNPIFAKRNIFAPEQFMFFL